MKKSIKLNAILNLLKQMCSLAFPLITVPYITRVLGTEHYGKVVFGNSIISYFVLLAGLGISSYAVREGARVRDSKSEFQTFVEEIFTINVMSTIVAYVLFFASLFCVPRLENYSILLVLQSFTIILGTIGAEWVNSIYEEYIYITIRYIVIQICSLILMFLFVKGPQDYLIYALIYVFATAGGNLFNLFYLRKKIKLRISFSKNLLKHLKPVVLLFFNTIAITIYVNSDITILGLLKNDTEVGVYSLATKIYLIIKQVFNAVIIVTLPRLVSMISKEEYERYKKLVNSIKEILITLLVPTIVGMIMLQDAIVLVVGGEEYVRAATPLAILSIALLFSCLASYLFSCVLLVHRLDNLCLKVSIGSALVNIVLNFAVIPHMSFNGAALTTLLSEIIVMVVYYFASKKKIQFQLKTYVWVPAIVGAIAVGGVCTVIKEFAMSTFIQVGMSIVVSVFVYAVIQIVLKNPVAVEGMEIVIKKLHSKS